MREATGEEAAEAAVPDARRANERPGASGSFLAPPRVAAGVLKRSRTVRIPLSNSLAFRILISGSSISMFGSRISTVAFPMLVLYLNHTPFVTGLVAFAVIAPSMLVYVPAGAFVDRWNPRRVMLVSEVLRGLVIASVVVSLAMFGKHTNLLFLMSAMVAEEIFETFFMLADRRYLSRLMESENVTSRQAYIEVRTHTVILAGRPLGPFLFEIQPFWPFVADALSFLFSIGSLVVLRGSDEAKSKPPRVRTGRPPRQLAKEIAQGFDWLRDDRQALITVILLSVTSLVAQALILVFLSEAHAKAFSTLKIGIVLAASGAGGAVGAILARFLSDEIRKIWMPIQMAAWSVALAFLMISGGLSVYWSAGAMLILGLTGAIGNIRFGTYLVSHVADDMIAKVTGIGQMLAIAASALGPVVGGFAVQHFGTQGAVGVLLVMVVWLALLSLLTPAPRHLLTKSWRSLSHMVPSRWPSLNGLAIGRINRPRGKSTDVPGHRAVNRDIACELPANYFEILLEGK